MNDTSLHILAWTFGVIGGAGALSLVLARLLRRHLNHSAGSANFTGPRDTSFVWSDPGAEPVPRTH